MLSCSWSFSLPSLPSKALGPKSDVHLESCFHRTPYKVNTEFGLWVSMVVIMSVSSLRRSFLLLPVQTFPPASAKLSVTKPRYDDSAAYRKLITLPLASFWTFSHLIGLTAKVWFTLASSFLSPLEDHCSIQLVTLFAGTLSDELEHLSKSRLGWQGSQLSRERERERNYAWKMGEKWCVDDSVSVQSKLELCTMSSRKDFDNM